jgi:hypothetical protein
MELRLNFSSFLRRSCRVALLLLATAVPFSAVPFSAVPFSAAPLWAAEPYTDFLRGLYDRGYGESALDYLKIIGERQDLPEDIKATLDLETASALRVAAKETQNADESAARLAAAQDHLDKFLKDHPDNPRAAAAYVTYGDLASTKGDNTLRLALLQKQEKGKPPSPLYEEARKIFEEARPRYQKATELYGEQFKSMAAAAAAAAANAAAPTAGGAATKAPRRIRKAAGANAGPTPQQIVEDLWIESRFKLAMLDFNIGRTYVLPDPLNPKLPDHKKLIDQRKAPFDSAAKEFDSIYQPNRTLRSGLYAHMWDGRVREEMGDLLTAQDIYEEVLANEPPPATKMDISFESLFVEVHQFRFNILLKQGKGDEVIDEAENWVKDYRYLSRTPGFQGIVLQLCKAMIEKGDRLKGPAQNSMYNDAAKLLKEAAKVPSPYESEIRLVLLDLNKKLGRSQEATFSDVLAMADQEAAQEHWAEAIDLYKKAIELGKVSKDPKDAPKVVPARFQMARSEYMAGKYVEAYTDAEALAKELASVKGDKTGPMAASLAVTSALNLYIISQGKEPELKRLQEVADFTIKSWPENAEADDARIALGKVEMVQGKLAEATATFEGVNPNSDRYSNALFLAAQTHFRLYLMGKQAPPDKQDTAALTAHRDKTIQELVTSIESEKKTVPKNQPTPKSLLESNLLLGEVYLEGNEGAKAVPVLDPIFVQMQAQKPKELDKDTLRICLAAVKSYMSVKDLVKAESVATLLMDVGADEPRVNLALIEFLKNVKFEWKQAMVAVIEDPKNAAAKKVADANAALLGKLLVKMATRQQLSLASMIFLADSCFDVSETKNASVLYESILKRAEDDPTWLGPNAGALIKVRAQLIGLLRADKKYEQALAEADKLIEATGGKNLDALMERGRILQAWSEQDPNQLPLAVAHWTDLRMKLQTMRKKPPEFFEVMYNAAFCLVQEAKATSDRSKAADAEKMLKSALILSPKLNGPDMVAKYKVLLDEAVAIARPG